jgi:putative glutamine amidotransferase
VRRPLVAISEGLADYGDYYGIGYARPVLAAGGMPVLLPYLDVADDRIELLSRVDGLVLAGGRDIEPRRYGREVAHPLQGEAKPFLDEIELSYAKLAVAEGVPVLGVCRGCQILNIAFGGTLYGDSSEYPEGGADHPSAMWEEWRELVRATLEGRPRPPHPTHPIDIEAGSMLASFLGERAVVDSYHHQAVRDLGDGVRAVAWAPHGVVEAIEMPRAPGFVLGVQWELHEEWQDSDAMLSIWGAFVAEARHRMDAREGVVVE